MKILITGGAGFIGGYIVDLLCDYGHEVTVIDSLSTQIHGDSPKSSQLFQKISGKCTFVHQRVEDIKDWSQYLDGMDALVHLAAETGTGQSMYQVAHYDDVNSTTTAAICEYLGGGSSTLSVVAFASSRSIYGEGSYLCSKHGEQPVGGRDAGLMSAGQFDPICSECGHRLHAVPTNENAVIRPSSIYALTKYYQECLLDILCRAKGINFFGLRLQNVYGPGQSLDNPYTGIMSIFSNLILNDRRINIFEDGLESRDFVFVEDVARIFVDCLTYGEKFNGVLNVGSGVAVDVLSVVKELATHYDKEVSYDVTGEFRLGDIRHNFADISRLKDIFGEREMVDFAVGAAEFCRWVKGQDLNEIDYVRSLNELKSHGMMGAKS